MFYSLFVAVECEPFPYLPCSYELQFGTDEGGAPLVVSRCLDGTDFTSVCLANGSWPEPPACATEGNLITSYLQH